MSHLVVVEVDANSRSISFPTFAGEPLTCLSSFAEKATPLYSIRQYGYHPEFGATLFEIIIDWGEHFRPGRPREGYLGEILEPTPLTAALGLLQKQYEETIEASITLVRHEGRVTRCSFKPKGEYREPPTTLDWTDIVPAPKLLV